MNTLKPSGVIRIETQGPPTVLHYTSEQLGDPAVNEILISQKAIAINFVDILFRNGTFPLKQFPATIGGEAAGVVESVGAGITGFKAGDRVAYYSSLGAYAERRLIKADDLVRLPDDISYEQAASILAKGLTARMLVRQAYSVRPGDVVLIHAAAGGVGSLVSRWAKALGATVIGSVGTAAKKTIALNSGADYVIVSDSPDFAAEVNAFTMNKGIDAVYDGVGKATFETSIRLLKQGGTAVLYGSASGSPQVDQAFFADRQLQFVRPILGQYLPGQHSRETAIRELFEAWRTGILGEIRPTIYPLADAARAHHDLESRNTTGSVILLP
ncbi:quinone oxidoreductase [Chitinophaga filiformis]|uniref:quinone oxidoreductase family protein n=1 Tax=Chitinophaga filiformis TaxID=104663 RepID=UPI001F39FD63|nr:quinone oxidoreductase [Chitinophaga filiformis]MCF6406237.1 quinone oxidoreductase [Chitinophaga filiformis]